MAGVFLVERMRAAGERDALVWKERAVSHAALAQRALERAAWLEERGVARGAVVALEADFSPESAALLFALALRDAVIVPIASSSDARRPVLREVAQVEWRCVVDARDEAELERCERVAAHPLYAELRGRGHAGLVLFTSGSTGESKAVVHDLAALIEKYRTRRPALRTLSFLLFDHIGGVNTLLHTVSNGGTLVTVGDRRPDAVLAAVERHRVEVLPVSPTFLNLVLLGEAWRGRDLASLQVVSYGTEPMLASTLARLHELWPDVRLHQTYGLSELGIMRSKSRGSDSLWVQVGGEGYETRVVDGVLQIRARSAMLGYLNAPSPFTADGWFVTGDLVEQDGEWLRILGRASEIVNVGGEKVFPAEVESVIQELDDVAEVVVRGERNPLVGQIVCARVTAAEGVDRAELVRAVKRHCAARLEPYKVPVKVEVTDAAQHNVRYKKKRSPGG